MARAKTKKKEISAPKASSRRKRFTFAVKLSEAREVFLARDFNRWNPGTHPMKHLGEGLWEKTVILPPGVYEYKLVVDGEWRLDAGNEATCANCFGALNNVVSIPAG